MSLKNYVVIDGKQFTLTPTNKEEYISMCSAIVTIVGMTALSSTDIVKDDKERVDAIVKFCGTLSADAAKFAISCLAEEQARETALKNDFGVKA